MKLKERIQQDFVTAMKERNEIAKAAISGLKAKITEAEKAQGNKELSEDEIIKVVNKAIKQREESMKIYTDAGRQELATKEANEADVLKAYMPAQMTDSEIETEVRLIIENFPTVMTNRNALVGKTLGTFNKNFQGRADAKRVLQIIERVAG